MGKRAALLLVLVFLPASCLGVTPVRAQTEIATSAFILVHPQTVEVGQTVGVDMWLEPAPPAPTDEFHGLTLKVTRPDGIIDVFSPPLQGRNSTVHWVYMPNQVGNFTFQFSYSGESFANGTIIYKPSASPVVTVTVPGTPRPRMEANGGSWVQKESMQQARGGLSLAAVNDKIYAIGGSIESGLYPPQIIGSYVGTNEEYDPATDTWTFKTPMPTRRASFAIAACQGKIYCIGGIVGTEKIDAAFSMYVLSGVNEVYDPVTDMWETKVPMPVNSSLQTANVVNGKIHMISGEVDYVYDPAADSWFSKAIPAEAGDYSVSAVIDNKIYLLSAGSRRLTIYDAETDNWSQGTPAPAIDANAPLAATTGVMAPKRLYVLGVAPYISGLDSSLVPAARRVNFVYDPESDSWTAGAVIPTYRLDFGVAVVNDTLYTIGGYTISSSGYAATSALNEQYTPIGYGKVPPTVQIFSPQNQTYTANNVSLTFTVNKPVVWMGYGLDGHEAITVTGNTTVADLPNGSHNVTVYAKDTLGNTGVSETISFTVATPDPFPPTIVVVAVVVAVVITGLLVYFKNRGK